MNRYFWKKKKKKKIKKKKQQRKRIARCDTMKITIFLLYSSDNSLLYCCTTVYVCSYFFVIYIYFTLIYMLLQSIFAHEKNTFSVYIIWRAEQITIGETFENFLALMHSNTKTLGCLSSTRQRVRLTNTKQHTEVCRDNRAKVGITKRPNIYRLSTALLSLHTNQNHFFPINLFDSILSCNALNHTGFKAYVALQGNHVENPPFNFF